MSRNLCQTECDRCGATPVLIESPRPITPDEAGRYFAEYDGLIVAKAVCDECAAQYLAWVDDTEVFNRRNGVHPGFVMLPHELEEGMQFFDLSYRSTFNDEPGASDLPPWKRPLAVRLEQDTAQSLLRVLHHYSTERHYTRQELSAITATIAAVSKAYIEAKKG